MNSQGRLQGSHADSSPGPREPPPSLEQVGYVVPATMYESIFSEILQSCWGVWEDVVMGT